MLQKLIPAVIKLDSQKRFDCVIVSRNQVIVIGNSQQNPEFRLLFKSNWTLLKALCSCWNILWIVEMFLNKEIDYEGDILKIFRIKNCIHIPIIRLN